MNIFWFLLLTSVIKFINETELPAFPTVIKTIHHVLPYQRSSSALLQPSTGSLPQRLLFQPQSLIAYTAHGPDLFA